MMSFFETVAGQQFVNYTIPELTRAIENSKTSQYYVEVKAEWEVPLVVRKEIDAGAKWVTTMKTDEGCLVIFEK